MTQFLLMGCLYIYIYIFIFFFFFFFAEKMSGAFAQQK